MSFNFPSNGGQAFCKELFSQEKSLSDVLNLIARATQKDHDCMIQDGIPVSVAVNHRRVLEEQLLKLVFKNHQEVLDEIDKQHNNLRKKFCAGMMIMNEVNAVFKLASHLSQTSSFDGV